MIGVKIVAAVFLVLALVVMGKTQEIKTSEKQRIVAKDTPTPLLTPLPTQAENNNSQGTLPTPTPKPTLATSSFEYPNSRRIRVEGEIMVLETQDSPQVVTNWYKEKIRQLNMNAKSFVQTTTNGDVLNKLAGSDGKIEVRVEITKKKDQQVVMINVSVLPEDSSGASVKIKI